MKHHWSMMKISHLRQENFVARVLGPVSDLSETSLDILQGSANSNLGSEFAIKRPRGLHTHAGWLSRHMEAPPPAILLIRSRQRLMQRTLCPWYTPSVYTNTAATAIFCSPRLSRHIHDSCKPHMGLLSCSGTRPLANMLS